MGEAQITRGHPAFPTRVLRPHFRGESSQNRVEEKADSRLVVLSGVWVSASRGRKAGGRRAKAAARAASISAVAGQSGGAGSKQRPSESVTWRTSTDTSSPSGSSQLSAVTDRGREAELRVSDRGFWRSEIGGLWAEARGTLFSEATPGVA